MDQNSICEWHNWKHILIVELHFSWSVNCMQFVALFFILQDFLTICYVPPPKDCKGFGGSKIYYSEHSTVGCCADTDGHIKAHLL